MLRKAVNTVARVSSRRGYATEKAPVRVVVTGASGNIGYALLPRIASGDMLGKDQPVILHLLELPQAMNALNGVVMEVKDCAFPLVRGIVATDKVEEAFAGADFALLVGARPRGKGMERGDLLKANAEIFSVQGKALNQYANRSVKTIVVGNPANTNAMIAAHFAPNIAREQITAMTRLDHNRGLSQLADRLNVLVTDIKQFAIWGNHSATQYPDVAHAKVNGKAVKDLINDEKWTRDTFIPVVQKRGAAIIEARGQSSAASAASSAIDHIRDWVHGTNGEWTSMAIPSDGSYGIDKNVWYSFPVTVKNGVYSIVKNLSIDEYSRSKMLATEKELQEERKAIESLLQ